VLVYEHISSNGRSYVATPPALPLPPAQTVNELTPLVLSNTATNADLSTTALTFGLTSAPDGVTLNPNTGELRWTPAEYQGPGTYVIGVQVTENGSPPLSDVRSFKVIVNERNSPPVLTVPADQGTDELSTLLPA